ncbi:MAG: CAP domain-containing protein [Mobilitalea sp.]
MKKLIITSACTLALSLTGIVGAYQYSSDTNLQLNANNSSTNVVENVTNKEVLASQSNEATPTTETGVLGTCTTVSNKIVYKNVDLSNCKSTTDVVKALRKAGYKNITTKNITKNKALKNVVATVKKNNAKKTTTTNKTTTTTPTPTKAPAKTTTTSTNSTTSSYAAQVLKLINAERAKEGLSALTTNTTLTSAANVRAKETKTSFSHTRPDGSSCFTALTQAGVTYKTAGENIAYGQKTPAEVVKAWMESPGHRANIMNANFHKVGIGVYQTGGVIYWSQLFTN